MSGYRMVAIFNIIILPIIIPTSIGTVVIALKPVNYNKHRLNYTNYTRNIRVASTSKKKSGVKYIKNIAKLIFIYML